MGEAKRIVAAAQEVRPGAVRLSWWRRWRARVVLPGLRRWRSRNDPAIGAAAQRRAREHDRLQEAQREADDHALALRGPTRKPLVGQRLLVVVVRCDCDDRWWAQPEGGYFPVCQSCGSEARPDGVPRMVDDQRPTDVRLAERREHAVGGILTVMMERDAIGEPRDG